MKSLRTILLTGLGWLVAFAFLAPYLQMLLTALKPQSELMASPTSYLPSDWEWGNFVEVWSAAPIGQNLLVSFVVAGCSTLIAVLVSLPAAYYTARHKFRGRTAFLLLVLVTQMFAPTALVIGIYREMLAFDLVDSYLALILVNSAFNLAFSTWILNGYISGIPVDLEEAAMLDGCNRFTVLTRVTLPAAKPGVVTAVIYTFIAAWNEYVVALTLSSTPQRQPLTVAIPSFVSQYHEQWQFLFAASLIAIVPVVILFVFIERYLVGGLTAGAVK